MQVIYGGTNDFNAFAYGEKAPGTMQYLQNQIQNISQTVQGVAKEFFMEAQQIYQDFNSDAAIRNARLAVRKLSGLFQRDEVRYLSDIGQIQNAPLTMQRWIMAEPTVRQLYHDQMCDGYSSSYVDVFPSAIGADHYDYRQVMNGILQDTPPDENGETGWKATIWVDDLAEGDKQLSFDEKTDIIDTWAVVRQLMGHGGEDPTSSNGGML